jgi:hypothetical protein
MFTRDWPAGHIHTAPGHNSFVPRLLAQLIEAFFVSHRRGLGSASALLARLCASHNALWISRRRR